MSNVAKMSVASYGFALFMIGLAVVFLINRVKLIDQRQRMLEMQLQNDRLKEEHVQDIVFHMLSDDALMRNVVMKTIKSQDSSDDSEPEPEVEVHVPPPPPPAPKKQKRSKVARAPSPKPATVEDEVPPQ